MRLTSLAPNLSTQYSVDPKNRSHSICSELSAEQGRANDAESLFKQALAASPRLAGAHINLGLLYTAQDRLQQAVYEFEQALQIDSSRGDAATGLTVALRKLAASAIAAKDRERALSPLRRKLAPSTRKAFELR